MYYKVIKKAQPGVPGGGEGKFYAAPCYTGKMSLRELSEAITLECHLQPPHVIAVLMALENVIPRQLSDGKIVDMGVLGSFRLSLKSKGERTPEAVNVRSIEKARVLFRPSFDFHTQVAPMHYRKVRTLEEDFGRHPPMDSQAPPGDAQAA